METQRFSTFSREFSSWWQSCQSVWRKCFSFRFLMFWLRLPSITIFWDCDDFLRNVGIQNIFARTRYQEVLQNNHFAGNAKQNKEIKSNQSRPIIDHLNESFQAVWQNSKDYVSCPNIINFYNNNMDGADIMDQKTAAYRLDRKSKYHFYLRMLFDLIDVPHETWWRHVTTEFQNCCGKSFDW